MAKRASEATSWRKPVVGIIDGGSRSGIEILAHGLKRAGAPLVGTKTAGDVLAGRAFRLRDNSLLELAVLDVRVDGVRLENNGVTPDVEVPFTLPYADGADPQFDRAVDEMADLIRDAKARVGPGRLTSAGKAKKAARRAAFTFAIFRYWKAGASYAPQAMSRIS